MGAQGGTGAARARARLHRERLTQGGTCFADCTGSVKPFSSSSRVPTTTFQRDTGDELETRVSSLPLGP